MSYNVFITKLDVDNSAFLACLIGFYYSITMFVIFIKVNQSGEEPFACHGSSCHPFTFYVLSTFGESYPCEGYFGK